MVLRSDIVEEEQGNPKFEPVHLNFARLCNNDPETKLKVDIFVDSDGDFLPRGSFETTVAQLNKGRLN